MKFKLSLLALAFLLFSGSASAANRKDPASIKKIPDVVYYDAFEEDSVTVEYQYAASHLYETYRYVDFNPAVSKFIYDEMLQRYQTMTDEAMRRAAFNRMREFLRRVSVSPPRVGMVRQAQDLYISDRVYRMLNDSLAAYNLELAAASKVNGRDYFRLIQWENTMTIRQPHYLDAGSVHYQVYLSRLKMNSKPVCIEDTMGVVDYDPAKYVLHYFADMKAIEPWFITDMIAKYRYFSNVIKDEQAGKLVCTASAADMRMTELVKQFFDEVLEGLNDPSARVYYPVDSWTSDPVEAERISREFFLAKNRGHSSKIYSRGGKLKKFYDPPGRDGVSPYYYNRSAN